MGIFSRFTDIVSANINALLDKAEDPKKMIRLIIQEMEETLVEVRSSSARIIADKKETQRQVERLAAEIEEWQAKAKLALSKSREDLARAALAEKKQLEDEQSAVEQELVALEEQINLLASEIGQLQDKLNDARAKQKAMLLRSKTVETRHKVKQQLHRSGSVATAEKFAKFERRMDDLEGQVESYDLGNQSLSAEIDELAKDDEISAELERLKAELNDKS